MFYTGSVCVFDIWVSFQHTVWWDWTEDRVDRASWHCWRKPALVIPCLSCRRYISETLFCVIDQSACFISAEYFYLPSAVKIICKEGSELGGGGICCMNIWSVYLSEFNSKKQPPTPPQPYQHSGQPEPDHITSSTFNRAVQNVRQTVADSIPQTIYATWAAKLPS